MDLWNMFILESENWVQTANWKNGKGRRKLGKQLSQVLIVRESFLSFKKLSDLFPVLIEEFNIS